MMQSYPLQLELFAPEVVLHRIEPACNMRRFYRLSLERDLFGGVQLVREWGRIGSHGRRMSELHPDEGGALSALLRLTALKRRRGYRG